MSETKETKGGPGFRRLKANPDYANMVQRTLAEQRRAIEEVKIKPFGGLVPKDRTPATGEPYPKPKRKS